MSGTISAEFPGLMRQRGGILTASDAGSNKWFGVSCSLSADGSVLAVGAYGWDGTNTDQGAVYIYDRSGSSWVQRGSVLKASDAGPADYFGYTCSLSADGQILAVGAYLWDGAYTDQGAVYIYDRSGSSWVQRGGILTASDAGSNKWFGVSCSLSADGSVLAVGAYGWDGTNTDQGAVYIYDRSGSSWVQRNILTATSPSTSEYFGMTCSLSADGSVLAVGGSDWNNGSLTNQGRVHIFDWNGSEWMQRSILNSPYILVGGERFGHSCSLSADGQILAVGAAASAGWVQIYDWNGSSWFQRGDVLTASDGASYDYFGYTCSLSADGQILAVGAYGWDGANTDQGAVYFFDVFNRTAEVSLKQMRNLFSRATDIFENEKNLIELESIRGGELYSKLCFRPEDIDLMRRFVRSPEIFSALNPIDKRNQRQDGFRTSQDHLDGGAFTIVGKVVKEGVPGQFIVRLFDRFGARCIRRVLSNPDGSFEFRFLRNNSDGYFLTAIDHTETNLGSGILDSPPLFHKTVEIPPYTSKQILNIGGCTNTVPVDPNTSAGKIEGVVKLNDQLTGADLYLVDLNVCSTVKSSSSDGKYGFYDDGSHSVIPESDKLVVICHYGPDSRPLAHGFVTPVVNSNSIITHIIQPSTDFSFYGSNTKETTSSCITFNSDMSSGSLAGLNAHCNVPAVFYKTTPVKIIFKRTKAIAWYDDDFSDAAFGIMILPKLLHANIQYGTNEWAYARPNTADQYLKIQFRFGDNLPIYVVGKNEFGDTVSEPMSVVSPFTAADQNGTDEIIVQIYSTSSITEIKIFGGGPDSRILRQEYSSSAFTNLFSNSRTLETDTILFHYHNYVTNITEKICDIKIVSYI